MPYLLLTLSALLWSGNFVIGRAVNTLIPPAALVFWRWVVAAVVLIPVVLPRLRQQWPIVKKHIGFICFCAFFSVTLFNFLIYAAMHSTTAINAALVNSAIPIFIIMFSRIVYRQRVSLRQHLGVALSLVGVSTIVLRGDPMRIRTLSFNRGDLLVLVAAVAWAVYSAALRRYPAQLDQFVFLFAMAVCGLVFLIPFYGFELSLGKVFSLTPATAATIGYVGIFASVIAFSTWNSGLRRIGPHLGGQFIHLMPAFSTVLAVFFLGERLHGFHLTGIALISTGILCATFRVRPTIPHIDQKETP